MMNIKRNIINHLIMKILFASLAPAAYAEAAATAGSLTVVVEGIRENKGDIKLSLDHNEAAFLDEAVASFRTGVAKIANGKAEFTFKNIPAGVYAVKLIHDIDLNEKLNTNLLGIPSEPYGISNDARAAFGLPGFAQASFVHSKKPLTIKITVSTHLPSFGS